MTITCVLEFSKEKKLHIYNILVSRLVLVRLNFDNVGTYLCATVSFVWPIDLYFLYLL